MKQVSKNNIIEKIAVSLLAILSVGSILYLLFFCVNNKPDTETTAFDTSLFIPIVDSNISRIPALVEDVDTIKASSYSTPLIIFQGNPITASGVITLPDTMSETLIFPKAPEFKTPKLRHK